MKKKSILFLMLCLFLQINAQNYVSTSVQNRNVVIEEFTGRNCSWCPDGHSIANQIVAANPNRVWAINIHAGGFSPTSFPNLNTSDGTLICNGYGVTSYPTGLVNRSTSSAVGRFEWTNIANTELAQTSEVNVAGIVLIDSIARIANITVEIYYTGNSSTSNNRLTVAMLQDSILGSQSGANLNPSQMLNGQYVHMHTLRDVITDTWGDVISPTTQGTLITKTYSYSIPETIGSPNGVGVDIPNIEFVAYVSEDNTNHTNVLTANMLTNFYTMAPYLNYVSCQPSTLEVNETTNLSVTIRNAGAMATTSNSNVTLTCSNSNLTIVDGSGTVGPMGIGASTTVDGGFIVSTSTNVGDGTVFPMTMTITNGSDSWTSNFNLTISTAELGYSSCSPTQISVGDNTNLSVQVENTGSVASGSANVSLTCSDPLMTIVDGDGSVNNVAVGGTSNVQGGFTIMADPTTANGHTFNMTMTISYKGRTFTDNFTLTVSAPCDVPASLSAEVKDYFDVDLSWNSSANAENYKVYRNNTEIATVSTTSYTDTDLEDGTYSYTVKTVCSNGTSNASNQANVTIITPCNEPSNLDGAYQWNSNDEFGVQIEFDAPDVTPHHYKVFRSTSNNNYEMIAEIESAESHVTYFDATEIACYYYQVTAYYEFGDRVCESTNAGAITPGYDYIRVCVTDVEENAENKMSIFPNPATENLTFNCIDDNEVSVMIYDLKGNEVMNFSFSGSKTIELENMPVGVYFVKMIGSSELTRRIIVK